MCSHLNRFLCTSAKDNPPSVLDVQCFSLQLLNDSLLLLIHFSYGEKTTDTAISLVLISPVIVYALYEYQTCANQFANSAETRQGIQQLNCNAGQ